MAHDLSVILNPDAGEITATDVISVDQAVTELEFELNARLSVRADNATVTAINTSSDGLRTAYRARLQTPGRQLKLQYHGQPGFSPQRRHGDMPQGVLSAQGVYLDSASAWYPLLSPSFDTMSMTVTLPRGWQSISIGRRTQQGEKVRWETDRPHDDLYLIAGRYTRHARRHGAIDLSVWLLDDDPALAAHYLDLMGGYIDHYSQLLGEYPYAKFAVVENRWQTGFGMPSFTLLGSRVLRLPFIPYTSLPHEILHNWLGNGVWVDYAKGNWSEGLTAYLADHWMQERQGKGDRYRLKALQSYSNFAAEGRDAPLSQFVSRHDDATQSIGYSKSLMLFHMLRTALGDTEFVAGLQRLWQRHRYSRIGFVQAVQTIAGPNAELAARLEQWLERRGAPRLKLDRVEVKPSGDGYRLALELSQGQQPAFDFDLPIAVMLEGDEWATPLHARVKQQRGRFEFVLPKRPLRIDIDPGYDLLRYLDATEQPPALNRLFGGNAWLILPSAAPQPMRDAWSALAQEWQGRYAGLRTIEDEASAQLAADADRIVLGWDNRAFADNARRFDRDDQRLRAREVIIGGKSYPADTTSVVLVSSDAHGVTTGFIGADSAAAVQSLARRLTHYGSYGRLLFDGAGGANLVKDALTSEHSSLSRQLQTEPAVLHLKPRPALGAD